MKIVAAAAALLALLGTAALAQSPVSDKLTEAEEQALDRAIQGAAARAYPQNGAPAPGSINSTSCTIGLTEEYPPGNFERDGWGRPCLEVAWAVYLLQTKGAWEALEHAVKHPAPPLP
jgi:hypothetical protein